MFLEFLTNEALKDINSNFSLHKEHYINNNISWFNKYFIKNQGIRKSKFECEDFIMDTNDDYNISDYKNIIILYSALKRLPLSVAVDERLWSGLAHGQLWDYVQYRRKKEIQSDSDQDIKNSYFFTRGIKRSAHINCLSRLWWAGHLSYDSSREDPFELTKLLCDGAFASTILLLSSSNLTANSEICLGILSSVKKRKDKGQKIKRAHFVEATKYLNSMGAVTILDSLIREDVERLIDDLFENKFDYMENEDEQYALA